MKVKYIHNLMMRAARYHFKPEYKYIRDLYYREWQLELKELNLSKKLEAYQTELLEI